MSKIGLDLDGVVYDFSNVFDQWAIKKHIIKNFRPDQYRLQERYGWTDEERNYYMKLFGKLNPFNWLPFIEGAKEGVQELLKTNDVYIITDRLWYSKAKEQTINRFKKDNINISENKIIFSNNKGEIAKQLNLDIVIDDYVENIKDIILNSSTNVLLFDHTHNKNYSNSRVTRVYNWNDILKITI